MNIDFSHKIVLITGGTGKLGKSLVNHFSQQGATVIYTTRNLKRAKVFGDNPNAIPFECDLQKEKNIKDLAKYILNKFKRIDIIINNAAVDIDQSFLSTTSHQFESLIKTNLMGPYYVCKYLIGMMIKQKKGKIINISSVLSNRTVSGAMEYSMSKSGLDSMSRSLAVEYGQYNISTNSLNIGVMPGMLNKVDEIVGTRSIDENFYKDWSVKKGRVPLRRRGTYEEYTQAVMFLASDQCNFINGASIPIDGGVLALL